MDKLITKAQKGLLMQLVKIEHRLGVYEIQKTLLSVIIVFLKNPYLLEIHVEIHREWNHMISGIFFQKTPENRNKFKS